MIYGIMFVVIQLAFWALEAGGWLDWLLEIRGAAVSADPGLAKPYLLNFVY